jgi:hypothetical protein
MKQEKTISPQEQKLKDLRELEAKRNNYMGLSGKFGIIVRALGQPITRESAGGGLFNQSNRDGEYDPFQDLKPGMAKDISNQIRMAYHEEINQPDTPEWENPREYDIYSLYIEGWHFDALNRGIHLEIWYKKEYKQLTVFYKGNIVYKEEEGDLVAFVPNEEWQNKIENLFEKAKEKAQDDKKIFQEKKEQEQEKRKEKLLTRLAKYWGFS